MSGILVYALHDDEGNFNKNSLGAISEAAKLAGEVGGEAAALVVGDVADDAAAGLGKYGAAKVYEILGFRADAEQIEEFSHMELFSLKASDSVIIFSAFDPARIGPRLHAALRSRGYVTSLLGTYNSNPVETIFYYAFLSQLAPLAKAQAKGLSEPYLAGARKKLQISDSMIY